MKDLKLIEWKKAFTEAMEVLTPHLQSSMHTLIPPIDALLQQQAELTRRETVEECIEVASQHPGMGKYCDTGADMDWYCRSECTETAIYKMKKLIDDK